jgi:hypothetical protein
MSRKQYSNTMGVIQSEIYLLLFQLNNDTVDGPRML